MPTEEALQDQEGADGSEVGGSEGLGLLVIPPVGSEEGGGAGRKGGREGGRD